MKPTQSKVAGTGVVKRKDGTVVQFKFEGYVKQEKPDVSDTLKRSPEHDG